MNYDELIDAALKKAKELPKNSTFTLKELFDKNAWDAIGNYRSSLGTKFRKRVEQGDFGIKLVQKSERRSNMFIISE